MYLDMGMERLFSENYFPDVAEIHLFVYNHYVWILKIYLLQIYWVRF